VVADTVQHGKYVELEAAHCSNFEQPEKFAAAVIGFCGE
jgi:pimeloyl-ACP methyl ester carboxylesterase